MTSNPYKNISTFGLKKVYNFPKKQQYVSGPGDVQPDYKKIDWSQPQYATKDPQQSKLNVLQNVLQKMGLARNIGVKMFPKSELIKTLAERGYGKKKKGNGNGNGNGKKKKGNGNGNGKGKKRLLVGNGKNEYKRIV